jgi:hypothetical protein
MSVAILALAATQIDPSWVVLPKPLWFALLPFRPPPVHLRHLGAESHGLGSLDLGRSQQPQWSGTRAVCPPHLWPQRQRQTPER